MFVCISLLMGQTRCILSPSVIVSNMVDWHTDYYRPAWFILPYCILSVCSQWIFRVTDKLNVWLVLIIGYGIYVFSSRMNVYDWFRMNIFQTLYIFFPFLLGGVMARTRLVERCDAWLSKMPLALVDVFLGCVLVVRYFLYTGAVISFFWAAVIVIAVHHVRRVGGGIVFEVLWQAQSEHVDDSCVDMLVSLPSANCRAGQSLADVSRGGGRLCSSLHGI